MTADDYPYVVVPVVTVSVFFMLAGHLAVGVALVMLPLLVMLGVHLCLHASINAYTHTEEWQDARFRAWVYRDLRQPCETLGHEFEDGSCVWCEKSRREPPPLHQHVREIGQTCATAGHVYEDGKCFWCGHSLVSHEELRAAIMARDTREHAARRAAGKLMVLQPGEMVTSDDAPYSPQKAKAAELRKLIREASPHPSGRAARPTPPDTGHRTQN